MSSSYEAGNQSLKFKVDENLPTECSSILRGAVFEADTVSDEKLSVASDSVFSERCRTEDRVLMMLDLDFANISLPSKIPSCDALSRCGERRVRSFLLRRPPIQPRAPQSTG
jgi:predicted nuclease of predicted toxin-antitoxin system